jgi:hypothetical protein
MRNLRVPAHLSAIDIARLRKVRYPGRKTRRSLVLALFANIYALHMLGRRWTMRTTTPNSALIAGTPVHVFSLGVGVRGAGVTPALILLGRR